MEIPGHGICSDETKAELLNDHCTTNFPFTPTD